MAPIVVSAKERPDLADRADEETASTVREWHKHAGVVSLYWGSLYEAYPEFQLVLYDEESNAVLGEGNTVPCSWDGTIDGVPGGIDDVLKRAFASAVEPNTLCALNIRIVPRHEGTGHSRLLVGGMRALARERGWQNLIAPVRPTWKNRYPLIPMEQYAGWTRDDGLPFDPWIRAHVRLGAEILRVAPESLCVTGTVAEWEEWTGMAFPASGLYVIPGAQVPLTIDRDADRGLYVEPDVWMRHLAG